MTAVGTLLNAYRKRSHLSQLDLGCLAEVSPRHISFIETGRARPSRDMLLRLADVMGLGLHDSNLLLQSGGFKAPFGELDLDDPAMAPVRQALVLMLENHNPFPALVLDADWNIVMVNRAQQLLAAGTPAQPGSGPAPNLLRLVFDPTGFRPLISNWDGVASHLLRRLRRQIMAYSRPGHVALLQQLLDMNPPADWQQPGITAIEAPVLTVDITIDAQQLRLFSTLSQFGTALDVGTEEFVVESYFPADKATDRYFRNLQTEEQPGN